MYFAYGFTILVTMVFGVLCFGYDVDQMYVFNLPQNSLGYVLILTYALNVLFTYPVCILPAHIVIDHMFDSTSETERNMSAFKKGLCRFILTIFIFCAAYFVPNLNALLGILGGLLGSMLQYVFPIVMHWKYFKGQTALQLAEYLAILAFAGSATVFGTYQSAKQLMV